MAGRGGARILTPGELRTLRYPIPRSWTEAAGLLKGKKRVDGLRYQKQVRRAWERRQKAFAFQVRS